MVKILQVVGYKKSGKTTTMNMIIHFLKGKGLTVAVIKHHGDKNSDEIDIPKSRDHITYMESGADESIVQGYQYINKLMKQQDKDVLDTLENIIQNEVTSRPDVILIEGYKQANYDKIVLFKSTEDELDLKRLNNIKLMVDTSKDQQECTTMIKTFINKWVDDTRETI